MVWKVQSSIDFVCSFWWHWDSFVNVTSFTRTSSRTTSWWTRPSRPWSSAISDRRHTWLKVNQLHTLFQGNLSYNRNDTITVGIRLTAIRLPHIYLSGNRSIDVLSPKHRCLITIQLPDISSGNRMARLHGYIYFVPTIRLPDVTFILFRLFGYRTKCPITKWFR